MVIRNRENTKTMFDRTTEVSVKRVKHTNDCVCVLIDFSLLLFHTHEYRWWLVAAVAEVAAADEPIVRSKFENEISVLCDIGGVTYENINLTGLVSACIYLPSFIVWYFFFQIHFGFRISRLNFILTTELIYDSGDDGGCGATPMKCVCMFVNWNSINRNYSKLILNGNNYPLFFSLKEKSCWIHPFEMDWVHCLIKEWFKKLCLLKFFNFLLELIGRIFPFV